MLVTVSIFLLSVIVLSRCATYIIQTLTRLAIYFKLSEFSVAFILMAVATSLPELMVGADAAFEHQGELALGTVLGSNIVNLTLIIGLPALLARGLRIESKIRNRDLFYTITLSLVPLVLIFDGVLSRADGVVLLLLYGLYLYRMLMHREVYTKRLNQWRKDRSVYWYISLFFIELLLLIVSAHFLVSSATIIAEELGVPLAVVGAAVVALGTSLPELSFELYAVRKHESGLALGNILGSVVSNSLLVLGVVAIISPVGVSNTSLFLALSLTWFITVTVFGIFLRSQYKLTAEEGFILVFLYVAVVLIQFTTFNNSLLF